MQPEVADDTFSHATPSQMRAARESDLVHLILVIRLQMPSVESSGRPIVSIDSDVVTVDCPAYMTANTHSDVLKYDQVDAEMSPPKGNQRCGL